MIHENGYHMRLWFDSFSRFFIDSSHPFTNRTVHRMFIVTVGPKRVNCQIFIEDIKEVKNQI